MPGITTLPVTSDTAEGDRERVGHVSVLVLAWSAEEPLRVGEIAMLPEGGVHVFGRGDGDAGETRVRFFRQRPGSLEPGPAIAGAGLSRRQLSVIARDGNLEIECIGQCELRVNGVAHQRAVVRPGDTIHLRRQVVLVFVRRAVLIPKGRHFPKESWGAFGEPDAQGIIGESPTTWLLREHLGFVAKAATHALLVGASGTGKELAARAIHAMSGRAGKPWVARNAATLPAGLIDAELFGNAKNYPNAGMPERPGLIGQADGGTLFLDEIAELPAEQQAHLLRVLDMGGEYQRLGESITRRSDFRLVGATNRDASALKHDLRARLTSLVELSPLSARREDIPLLARHLLISAATRSPDVAGRFVEKDARGRALPRFTPAFVESILRQELETNTRELEAVLWKAMSEATGSDIGAPSGRPSESSSSPTRPLKVAVRPPAEPSLEQIRGALSGAGGSIEKAARALGVSRFALYRLMKKHGLKDISTD
jgi:two-component system response regulator HydG